MNSKIFLYKIFLVILTFSLNFEFIYAQQKNTGLEFGLGFAPNFNFHNSSFTHFEGYPNCCSEFSSGFGIGYSLNTFIGYFPKSKIIDKQWGFKIVLSYDNLSGTLITKDFFANIIVGNDLRKGISEHKLVTDLKIISFEPELLISLFENIPLDFNLGFRLGFFSKTNFEYSERLLSPEGAAFENYSTVRNITTGDIPDISHMNIALSVGANYKLLEFANFKVSTDLRFYYNLSNIVKNLDWKANNLKLGLNIAYSIPKANSKPPIPSPMPDYPKPPEIIDPDAKLLVFSEGKRIEDGDTVRLDITKEIETRVFPLIPIIFFEKNSSNIPEIIIKPPLFKKQYSLNKEILRNTAEILKNSPDLKITITSSYTSSEDENIAIKRFAELVNYFEQSGINKSRITLKSKLIESQKDVLKANEDENYFVQIHFDTEKKIYITEETEIANSVKELEFEIKTQTENPQYIKEIAGKICLNDIMLDNFYTDSYKFKLNKSVSQSLTNDGKYKFHINAVFIDIAGHSKVGNLNFVLKPFHKNIIMKENSSNDLDSHKYYSEFILGYFNFDESNFSYIDERVKGIVLENFNKGKKIEILPFTDNIGTAEYNKNLAAKRAQSAIRELNLDKNKFSISITGEYPFKNDLPHQRIYNRSVFIRIYDLDSDNKKN